MSPTHTPPGGSSSPARPSAPSGCLLRWDVAWGDTHRPPPPPLTPPHTRPVRTSGNTLLRSFPKGLLKHRKPRHTRRVQSEGGRVRDSLSSVPRVPPRVGQVAAYRARLPKLQPHPQLGPSNPPRASPAPWLGWDCPGARGPAPPLDQTLPRVGGPVLVTTCGGTGSHLNVRGSGHTHTQRALSGLSHLKKYFV